MKLEDLIPIYDPTSKPKHPKCLGYRDYWGEFDCEYQTGISCEECKYGVCGGRKDPEAKCNAL